MIGAPFQPPIKPGVNVDWKDPVLVQDQIMAIAKGSADGSPSAVYLLDGGDGRSLKQVAGIQSDSMIASGLAAIGKMVFVVVNGESGDQLVGLDSQNELGSTGAVDLPGKFVAGPWAVGDKILVKLDTDELACFDTQLTETWKIKVPGEQFAGQPILVKGKLAIALQNGQVMQLDSATGTASSSVDLGQPVVSVTPDGDRLIFGGMDGTVHVEKVTQ